MKKGYYLFEYEGKSFYLPLNTMSMYRVSLILKSNYNSVYMIFFGLDPYNVEEDLQKQLIEYFKKDSIYEPSDIHPALQGDNYDKIRKYPVIFERIKNIKVKYHLK